MYFVIYDNTINIFVIHYNIINIFYCHILQYNI